MINLFLLTTTLLLNPIIENQKDTIKSDSKKIKTALYFGFDIGGGIVGGENTASGLVKSHRFGMAINRRLIIGLERFNSSLVAFRTNNLSYQSVYFIRFAGVFTRYYFMRNESKKQWRLKPIIMGSIFLGDFYSFSTYPTAFKKPVYAKYTGGSLGAGLAYRINKCNLEVGVRRSFLSNKEANFVRLSNAIFIGISRTF